MDEANSPVGPKVDSLMALIDTGAAESCISLALAERMGIRNPRVYRFEAGALQEVDRFRCRVELGSQRIINNFIVYVNAKPDIDVIN